PLNTNFYKKEFQELWAKINRKAIYRVKFDSDELVQKCVSALNRHLQVTPLQYMIQAGEQKDNLADNLFHGNDGFKKTQTKTEYGKPIQSRVKYDLIGKISENTVLTRKTSTAILQKIQPEVFEQFKKNPEHFISELSRIVTEQKASIVIERLTYDEIDGQYGVEIFTAGQIGQDFSRATEKLRNHIYDYVITDSIVERNFVQDLDTSREVVVYAKLPRGFMIPTPVGDYCPDWAISFRAGSVRQIYFVAETKGTMSSMELRKTEKIKIDCARKFFQEIVQKANENHVNYDVVPDYAKLMDIVGAGSTQTEIMMR
ncbi:MAG: restriction endonuclease subunit R, partial [Gammaproteobacteria bacterium]|nr:restriction endonuclease subunit R [Gammaproteobacteria bacterium]